MIFWSEINRADNSVLRTIRYSSLDTPEWAVDTELSYWIQKDISLSYRGIAPVFGAIYLEDFQEFVRPKPYESWIFNANIFDWSAPVEHPDPDPFVAHLYEWDEESTNWYFYADKLNTKQGY
jgi:hypothetical protein